MEVRDREEFRQAQCGTISPSNSSKTANKSTKQIIMIITGGRKRHGCVPIESHAERRHTLMRTGGDGQGWIILGYFGFG